MKINLRKANAIQASINDVLRTIQLKTQVNLNEFHSVGTVIGEARSEVIKNLERKIALTNALYAIRKVVGEANNSGVDQKLAEVAQLEKTIQIYSELANATVQEDGSIINGKLDKIRNRPADSRASLYGYSDEITVGVLGASDIETMKKNVRDAKKKKQALQDEILELNVRTEVELDAATVATLVEEQLV